MKVEKVSSGLSKVTDYNHPRDSGGFAGGELIRKIGRKGKSFESILFMVCMVGREVGRTWV
jgi:hypothetical protein